VACDYLVLGAGIVGLSIARALRLREPGATIAVLEKEPAPGLHASGRNSGVLHSGIYYPEGSLKARVCAEGARRMAALCEEHGLPLRRTGKVIVPVREDQDPQIDLLARRALANGARVSVLDSQGLSRLEPEVRSASGRALHSPDTAVVDPKAVVRFLADWLGRAGVEIRCGATALQCRPDESSLSAGGATYRYGRLFNATGQFADLTARRLGLADRYRVLPFKGIYYRLSPDSGIGINGLVYPVPDLDMPFLGVHSVKSVDGTDYFGPTAVPAFGREHYRGLAGVRAGDAASILYRLIGQYLGNRQNFRAYFNAEAGRFLRPRFAAAARQLVPRLRSADLLPSDKVGIRAQLLDTRDGRLVMDFLVERRDNVTHVLNAVSPAFTSALAFADRVLDA
jgi:L-2-hydroxyglutarate oxidase LhgO